MTQIEDLLALLKQVKYDLSVEQTRIGEAIRQVAALPRESEAEQPVFAKVAAMIRNGVVTTLVDLDAEIQGHARKLGDGEPERLRELLAERYPIREATA